MSTFLKQLGYGVLAALVGGVAAYFLDPANFVGLGAFAGVVTMIAGYLGEALKKLADKINPKV